MNKILVALLIVSTVIITACGPKVTFSEEKVEKAEVLQMIYLPDTEQVQPVTGVSTSGNVVLGVTVT